MIRQPVRAPLMRTPRQVEIAITSRCNLRCRYCYHFESGPHGYRDLPVDEWRRFFDELGRLCVMEVVLSGGEPLLREDLAALVEGIVANRMRFTVLTNGGLLTAGLAALLARTGRCNQVQVSVDGATAAVHDRLRGEGAFDGAIRGLRLLLDHGVGVGARVTIHRGNLDDLEAIAGFLLEELGLPGFSTNASCYLGACRENSAEVLLDTRQWERAMETLLLLSDRYPGRISAAAGPLYVARRWREMDDARRKNAPPFADGGRLAGCGCSASKLAVRSDGVIVPCTMLPHLELGRINDDPLDEIWWGSPQLDALRRRGEIRLDELESCRGCGYVPYCSGDCPAVAYTLTGDMDRPSPDACLRSYLEGGGRLA